MSSGPGSRCWLVFLLILLAGCGRVGGEPFQGALNNPITLDDQGSVAQTINPAGGSISQLDVTVATFAAATDPSGELRVTLTPVGGSTVLGTTTVSGADMVDGSWVSATFDPAVVVPDVVLATFTWEGDTPLAVWADTTLPGTSGIQNDPYAKGQLVVDGRPTEGDLAFRVLADGGPGAVVEQVGEVARTGAARLLDEPVFLVLWGLALVGATVLATGLRRRRV